MNSALRRACVMGHPISHSRSPKIHGYWLAQLGIAGRYELVDRTPASFAEFFTHLAENGYVGGNITVPHKEAAYRLVAQRDRIAEAVGAVNTVWYEGTRLVGSNSDPHGFIANLDELAPAWNVAGCRAVILGAGGAARSAAYALIERGADVSLANRTIGRARALAEHLGPHVSGHGFDELHGLLPNADLLVNCTSLGMIGKPPLEVELATLKRSAVVYDVVYVPLETALLAQARARPSNRRRPGHAAAPGRVRLREVVRRDAEGDERASRAPRSRHPKVISLRAGA